MEANFECSSCGLEMSHKELVTQCERAREHMGDTSKEPPPVKLILKHAGFTDDGRFFEDTIIQHRGCSGVFQIAFPSEEDK